MIATALDGVALDIDRSCVVLDGRPFPAGLWKAPTGSTLLDGPYRPGSADGWTITVPIENGTAVGVALDRNREGGPLLALWLYLPWCRLDRTTGDWMMAHAWIENGIILTDPRLRVPAAVQPVGWWEDCEPGWAADQLDRIARHPVRLPTVAQQDRWQRAEFVRLSSARWA